MTEIVLPPSPNWYLSSIVVVAPDGSIIYGSSTKDITFLTPFTSTENKQSFKLTILHAAHKKKITCLALCPNWNITQHFVSGSEDGIVKLWSKITASYSIAHNLHFESNEDVIGVTFLNEKEVVSVGNTGIIVLWNVKQNTVKADNRVLKTYKPLCVSLCPLKQNTIAIGTKQGVVLVLSVTDKFMMLFKAHGHETEVTSLSWCPTPYCDPLEKIVTMKRHKVKTFRVRKISNRKPDSGNKSGPNTTDSGLYQQSSGEEADESDIFDVNKDTGHDECLELSDSDYDKGKKNDDSGNDKKTDNLSDALQNVNLADDSIELEKNEAFVEDCKKLLNFMNSKKALKSANVSFVLDPDDSMLNESQVKVNPAEESDIFDIYKEPPIHEFGHSKYFPGHSDDESVDSTKPSLKNDYLEECKKLENLLKGKEEVPIESDRSRIQESEKVINTPGRSEETFNESAADKSIFDIYEEPPFYEFGHTKYVPGQSDNETDEKTKLPRVKISSDFLEECNKLSQQMAQAKSDDKSSENESVSVLSNQVNKLQITNSDDSPTKVEESSETQVESREGNYVFLASVCKNGKVCIWRWGGNLVSSGNVPNAKDDKLKKLGLPWSVLLWPSSKLLFVASRGAQLFRCNFNSIYPRSKGFGFSLVHDEHIRGLYCIAANVNCEADSSWRSRGNTPLIWSVGQDRMLISYSPDDSKIIAKFNTFGGYITNIAVSPIDPNRFAISAGDGVIRVWEFSSNCTDNSGLGNMKVFWQNVQGKVQGCDWHPTKEHIIAFGNAEGRVGIIDSNTQAPAKLLSSSLSLGVHGVSWGPSNDRLYAHGTGKLVMYDTAHMNKDPVEISVTILNRKWEVTSIAWSEEYFTVGSKEGGVALLKLDYPHDNVAFAYPHRKRIICMSWHPLAVSSDDGISPCANLLAVSANNSLIVILKLVSVDGEISLEVADEISSHTEKVNKVCWSPHHNGRLLSVSSDNMAQVYDVINKCPLHTLLGHSMSVLCCLWSPTDSNLVMTAGEDFSLRVWNLNEHPYQETKPVSTKSKKKMRLATMDTKSSMMATKSNDKESKTKGKDVQNKPVIESHSNGVLAQVVKPKQPTAVISKSALSLYWKQVKTSINSVEGCRRLFNYYISKITNKNEDVQVDYSDGYDYLRIYGSQTEVNQLLDIEQQKLEETLCWERWTIVGLLRGDLKTVVERARDNKQLTPSLLSLAPSVSNRFWKDMMSSYVSQLESAAKNESNDIIKDMNIPIYQSIIMLASGAVEDACNVLVSEGLVVDALIAAKVRHAEHIAEECLQKLLAFYKLKQRLNQVAECYLASGKLMDAAMQLGLSNDEEYLALAADIAKQAGDTLRAQSIVAGVGHSLQDNMNNDTTM